MSRVIGKLRIGALTVAVAALAGCGDNTPATDVAPVPVLTEAEANARTTVPLTRTVSIEHPGVIADFEFDLPPPASFAGPTLVIGIRIREATPKAIVARSSLIWREGLPARVRLQRVDGVTATNVLLRRIGTDLRTQIELDPDGFTPGVKAETVSPGLLRRVGLVKSDVIYDSLAFAHAGAPAPGRYHVRVELLEERPQLKGTQAELILGYGVRSK